MMKLILFAAIVPLAFALPAVTIQQRGVEVVHLTWFTDRIANKSSLLVTGSNKEVYGHACADALTVGNLDFKLDVDKAAQGNLTVGSTKYIIHENPKYSGGITCDTIYDDVEAHINCVVPWTAKFKPKILPSTAGGTCLKEHLSRRSSYDEPLEEVAERSFPVEFSQPTSGLDKRQGGNCAWNRYTHRIGNGNPHQNFRHTQISEAISCGNGDCTVGWQSSTSYTVGWEATGNLIWIAGGFAVSKTVETGNSYQCDGSKGQSVAIRYKMALTAYTVETGQQNACSPNIINEGVHIIWSPNTGRRGGKHYCIRGATIRFIGHTFLEKEGPAGGPEIWLTRPPGSK